MTCRHIQNADLHGCNVLCCRGVFRSGVRLRSTLGSLHDLPAYSKCWPTRLQRLMLQRSFPIRSEATIHAWRLPYGVGWTRYSSTLPQLYLVYFSWVGLWPNLLSCNKDSIRESFNKIQVWLNFQSLHQCTVCASYTEHYSSTLPQLI